LWRKMGKIQSPIFVKFTDKKIIPKPKAIYFKKCNFLDMNWG
jgi:exopolysaccharide biosynthesis predicted pyruvyltransferase EpsI